MSRMLWFGLGMITGMTYASRIFKLSDLANVDGGATLDRVKNTLSNYQDKAADMVEQRAGKIGDAITDRASTLADSIRNVTLIEESQKQEPVHAGMKQDKAEEKHNDSSSTSTTNASINKPAQPGSQQNNQTGAARPDHPLHNKI